MINACLTFHDTAFSTSRKIVTETVLPSTVVTFRIRSGKAASSNTVKYSFNVLIVGSRFRETFIKECIVDSKRFDQRIRKQNISAFVAEEKCTIKENKSVEVRMEHELFGSIILALQLQFLGFECHADGTMP